MKMEHYRQLLLAKEKELVEDLARAKTDVKGVSEPDVQDEMDQVVRSEEKESLLHTGSRDFDILEQVRDALERIEDRTYGKCLECGRPIEEKRLEAIPWAAYDLRHQAETDRELHKPASGPTL